MIQRKMGASRDTYHVREDQKHEVTTTATADTGVLMSRFEDEADPWIRNSQCMCASNEKESKCRASTTL
ncbi:hypothetical protein E3N88_28722 [Mikania micrantha]|uniref:Uncharacterized protein n=1 Tax=Mikania micrantha TaxID=192012 RepID=A0A5N6N0U8_9ASTR|nr:hypothetical protein E3N88_28722 [Mikania micrantha]